MNEELKCPCCGNIGDTDSLSFACLKKGCHFSCSLRLFNRISAAMEFARAAVWAFECEDQRDYMDSATRHRALVEAVERYFALRETKRMKCVDDMPVGEYTKYYEQLSAARAEVDRLIANESAADCKGEG